MFLRLVLFASLLVLVSAAGDWSYAESHGDGPSKWKDVNADCGKSVQSLIDLAKSTFSSKLTTPKLTGFNALVGNVTLKNSGYSVVIALNQGITVSLPNVTGTFKAAQFHFHWGTADSKGSEHTVDGKMHPMEMHIVTVNSKYADITAALPHADGLAVLGYFITVGAENANFNKIVNALSSIKHSGNTSTISGFKLDDIVLPAADLKNYYRYQGSLTTPPCSEAVTWTVFSKPLTISAAQLAAFRNDITLDSYMTDNFRPVQPLGARMLYTSDETLEANGASEMLLPSATLALLSILATRSIF